MSDFVSPLLTVCVPTYNGAKYLQECLDSILCQTFTEFELLIIDDCSSDDTLNIVNTCAERDRRIRVVVNNANLGLVGNWNRCINLAQGEWIKFVFQDDLLSPTCLEKMLAARQPEKYLINCRRQFIFEAEVPKKIREEYQKFLTYLSTEGVFSGKTEISAKDYCEALLNNIDAIYANFVGEPTAVMLHRSVFDRFGTFNHHLIQLPDFEFWTRIAIHSGMIYVPETLATFRIHSNSATATNYSGKKYRTSVLDKLIFIYDLAFDPLYEPLRFVNDNSEFKMIDKKHNRPVNLFDLVTEYAYNSRRIAQRAAANRENPDSSLLTEWEKIQKVYPLLTHLSQRSLTKKIISHSLYRWKDLRRNLKATIQQQK